MRYPLGIQTFERLLDDGCVYVDKTQYIYNLVSSSAVSYILTRPRRFGKSLLLTTLKSYFEGRKDLFKGLAIEKLEKDWTTYPVLFISFGSKNYEDEGKLENSLRLALSEWEEIYGKNEAEINISDRFKGVIERAYKKTGKRVVVLVDEYDKPLLDTITNKTKNDNLRKTLKEFYSVLKTYEHCIRFAFLTGVTRFSHVSIFSDLNQLEDISMAEDYAGICGISEEELHKYFDESIELLAQKNELTFQECCDELRVRYDGYHFHQSSVGVYNPFSLLKAFARREFSDYWFASGTPTFLVELLQKNEFNLKLLEKTSMTADMIGNVDNFDSSPIPIIYQSGYLTIKDYNSRFKSYALRYPNKEVEEGFVNFLLPYYTPINGTKAATILEQFVNDVEKGNADSFLQTMKTLLDGGNYQIAGDKEIYFQNCMYLIFKLMGFYVQVEYCTSQGRIDIVLGTTDYLYVMELKVGTTAQEALTQIDQKGYMLPFKQDHRKLYKIGVAFNLDNRSLEDWLIQEA